MIDKEQNLSQRVHASKLDFKSLPQTSKRQISTKRSHWQATLGNGSGDNVKSKKRRLGSLLNGLAQSDDLEILKATLQPSSDQSHHLHKLYHPPSLTPPNETTQLTLDNSILENLSHPDQAEILTQRKQVVVRHPFRFSTHGQDVPYAIKP